MTPQWVPLGRTEKNEISVGARVDSWGRVVVEIADAGRGIAPEILGRIFGALESDISRHAACGRARQEKTHPAIGIQEKAPVKRAEDAGEPPPMPLSLPAMRRGSILVVEDDPMLGAAIRRVFCRDNDVTLATNGKEALDLLLAGRRFDAILCDLDMPQMTGMELFDELARTQPELCERMVFVTGGAFTPSAKAFLDRVPNRHVDKPFVPEDLRTVVRFVISGIIAR